MLSISSSGAFEYVSRAHQLRAVIQSYHPIRALPTGVVPTIDGIAVQPFPFAPWVMGPGTRIDVVLRAPRDGRTAQLIDMSHGGRVELAHFIGKGPSRRKTTFDPAPLRAARMKVTSLKDGVIGPLWPFRRLRLGPSATDGHCLLMLTR
jgi:hypothetical protein